MVEKISALKGETVEERLQNALTTLSDIITKRDDRIEELELKVSNLQEEIQTAYTSGYTSGYEKGQTDYIEG